MWRAINGSDCTTVNKIANLRIAHIGTVTLPYEAESIVGDFEHDIVIGLATLKQHNILLGYPGSFFSLDSPAVLQFLNDMITLASEHVQETQTPAWNVKREVEKNSGFIEANGSVSGDVRRLGDASTKATCHCACNGQCKSKTAMPEIALATLNRELNAHSTFSDNYARDVYSKEDIWEISDTMLEAIPSDLIYASEDQPSHSHTTVEDNIPTQVFGPESLRQAIRYLLEKYKHIFSREINPVPAKLNPFEFRIDENQWQQPNNHTSRRRYDRTRSAETKKIVDKLLAAGVIRPATNPSYYSHGFVVPKSGKGQWRFVADYKNLNKCTSMEHWPLPNIKDILLRLGEQRPKYFCVMDLTSGYHQAPISKECIPFTAFMTDSGIYEFVRLPMGLKGAGSYFQKALSTEVFAGLIQLECELYLDDLISPSNDEEECIARLETLFQRCEQKNITLHPDKCKFGLSEVEYVGHTIDENGIHFTRSRLDSILNFAIPNSQKDLKSFLGFANYFRDHVQNYAMISASLYAMTKHYNRKAKLKWTDESKEAYDKVLNAVHNCPALFFIDEYSPIFLHTDASDYGCGAYLFQVRISEEFPQGKEFPIAFISKSFDERMSRWDTPQKEGFAIFHALDKLDYLLRDRHFTIRTDHANLTKLKHSYSTNKKVQRWFLAMQQYDFDIEPIAGKDNVIGDNLSRFCERVDNHSESVNSLKATKLLSRMCIKMEPLRLFSYKLVSNEEQYKFFLDVHNDLSGHCGEAETQRRLTTNRQQWRHMHKDIKKFIKLCPTCQKNNVKTNTNVAFPFTVSSLKPMEKVQLDFLVKLKPDEKGIDHIMVIIDCFSRFVTLYPLKGLDATQAAEALIAHGGTFGIPDTITHDNDPVLIGSIVTETIRILGSRSHRTMSYSKEENAIVERANKEVLRHLRNFISDRGVIKNYSTYIPLVQRIINASLHKATGFTPAQLVFGLSVDLNRGTMLHEKYLENTNISYPQWVEELRKMQGEILQIAKETLTAKDEIHLVNYPINQTEFDIGSYVLVEYKNAFRKGPSSKLLPFLKGPMLIVAKDKSKYSLRDLITNKVKDHHVKRLSPFEYDPSIHDPLKVALRDTGDLFVVERISKFRGNARGRKSQLEFLVHWVGYEETSWEPWGNVRNNILLHNFLRNHKSPQLRNLAPKQPEVLVDDDSESEDDFTK